jgi:hypothetical protein
MLDVSRRSAMRTHEATRNGVAAILASTLVLPVEARTQGPAAGLSPVVVGSRVRIVAPTTVKRIEGIVAAMDDASLLVSTDDHVPVRVQRQAITRLEVSTGRHRRTLKGLIIGVGIGAGLGAVTPRDFGCLGSCPDQKLEVVGGLMLVGAFYGAGIGALIKRDRWREVPLDRLRVGLTQTRGRGVGLSLSVQF